MPSLRSFRALSRQCQEASGVPIARPLGSVLQGARAVDAESTSVDGNDTLQASPGERERRNVSAPQCGRCFAFLSRRNQNRSEGGDHRGIKGNKHPAKGPYRQKSRKFEAVFRRFSDTESLDKDRPTSPLLVQSPTLRPTSTEGTQCPSPDAGTGLNSSTASPLLLSPACGGSAGSAQSCDASSEPPACCHAQTPHNESGICEKSANYFHSRYPRASLRPCSPRRREGERRPGDGHASPTQRVPRLPNLSTDETAGREPTLPPETQEDSESAYRTFHRASLRTSEDRSPEQTVRHPSAVIGVTELRREDTSRPSSCRGIEARGRREEILRRCSGVSLESCQKQSSSGASPVSEDSDGGESSPCSFAVSQQSACAPSCGERLSGVTLRSGRSPSELIFAPPDEGQAGGLEAQVPSEAESAETAEARSGGRDPAVTSAMSHPSRLFERSASSRIPDSSWIDRVPGGSPSQSSLEARNESRVDFASSVEERELTRRATRHHEEGVSDDPQGGASEIEKEATAPPSGEDEAPFPSTVTAGAPRVSLSKETLASDKDSPASAAAVDPRDAPPSPASRAFSPQAMPDFAVSLTEQKAAWSRPVAASLQSPRGPFPPPAVCPYGGDGRVAEAASPCRPADSLSSVAECFVSLADEAPASSLARPSSGKTATSSPESLLSAQPGLSGREPDLTSTAEETGHTHTALPSPTSSVESPTQRLLPVRASNAQNALPPSQIDSNVRVGRDAPLTCLASPTFPNEGETPSEGSAEPHSVSQQEQEANISFWNGQRGDAVTAGPSPEAHAPSEAEQAAEEGERRLETEEDLAKPCQKDTTPVQGTDNTDRSRDQGTWAETRNEDAFQDSTAELTSTERVLATVGKGVTSVFERGAASLVDFFTETLPYLVEPHGAQRPARVRSSSFTPNRQFLATTASTLERPHTAAGSVGRRARSISPLRERVRGFTSGTVFECGGPGEHQSLDSSDEGEPRVPQRRTKNPQELARAVVRKRKDNKGYKTHLHPSPATGPTRLPPLPPRRASADVSRGLGDRLLCFPSAAPQSPSSRPKSTTSLRAQTPPLPTCSRTRSASSRRPEDVERDERRRTSLRPGFMHQSLDGRQHFGPCGAPTIGQNGALPSLDVGVCRLQCASPAQLYTTALSQLPFVSPEQQDYVRVPRIQSFSLQQAGCRRVSSMASEAAFPFVRASPTSALGVPSCASVPGHGGLHSYKVLPRTADSSSSGIYSFSTAVPVSLATDSTFVASRAESPGPHGTVAHLRSAPAVDQSFGVSPHFLHPCLSGSPWRVNPHAATPLRNCTEPPQFGAVPLPAPSKFPIGYRSAASLDMSSGGPLQTDPASGVVCSVTRQLNDTQGLRPCRLLNLAHKIERGRDEGRTETPGRSAARTEELGTLYTRTSTGKEMQTHAKAQYPTERAAGTACTEGKGESSAFTLLTSYGDVGGEYRKPPSRLRALWLREELRRQREAGELTKENFPMEEFQDLLEPFEILEVGGVKVYKLTADWKLPQSVPSREWIERNHREGHEFTACLEDITDVANQLFLPASATA